MEPSNHMEIYSLLAQMGYCFYCFSTWGLGGIKHNKINPKGNCMWKPPCYNLEVIDLKMQKSAGLVFRIFMVTFNLSSWYTSIF